MSTRGALLLGLVLLVLLALAPVDLNDIGVPYPGLRSRLLLTIVMHLGACVALTRFVMTRQSRFLRLSIVAGLLAVVAALSVMQEIGRLTREVEQPVVVIAADQVILRKGNGDSYPPRRVTWRTFRSSWCWVWAERHWSTTCS